MALSNSERQRRFLERRLGAGGRYERIGCLVSISTKRNLERLSAHFGLAITEIVERLINEKATAVLQGMNDSEKQEFFEEKKRARKSQF
jgi:hypothetical protein